MLEVNKKTKGHSVNQVICLHVCERQQRDSEF